MSRLFGYSRPPIPTSISARSLVKKNAALFGLGYIYRGGVSTPGLVSTPDHSSLDITGDLDLRALIHPGRSWNEADPAERLIIAKRESSSPADLSYQFLLSRQPGVTFFSMGWTEADTTVRGELSSEDLDIPPYVGPIWVRATLDVDNGAGGYEVKFYYSLDSVDTDPGLVVWVQHGTTMVGGVTTNIRNTVSAIELGSYNDGLEQVLDGKFYYAEIRDGIDGTIVANPDFRYRTDLLNYVTLSGASAYVATPDHASLDITGDIDLRVDTLAVDWTPGINAKVIAKLDFGNSTGYEFYLNDVNGLTAAWFNSNSELRVIPSTAATGITDNTRMQIRATVAFSGVNDQTIFYTRAATLDLSDNTGWTQLGATVNSSSTAGNIRAGISQVVLGADSDGVGNQWNGRIYEALILNGINGTAVASPDFRRDGISDASGKVWSYFGAAKSGNDPTQLTDSTKKIWTVGSPIWWALPLQGTEPAATAINLSHIGPTAVVNAPSSINGQVVNSHIGPVSVVNDLVQVTGSITGDHIGPTSILTAPTITGAITLTHIGPTSVVNAPSLLVFITLSHIGPIATVNAPRLFASMSLQPVSVTSNVGWDTGPTGGGDLIDAIELEDSDFITVTV